MTMPEHDSAQAAAPEPFPTELTVGPLAGHQTQSHGYRAQLPGYQQTRADVAASREPLAPLSLEGFDDTSFNASSWLDMATESLADHPLLRGLLLELPPKGTQPSPEWLNRWFEATRAVLDLIYVRR